MRFMSAALSTVLVSSGAARAQVEVHEIEGPDVYGAFGSVIATIGDVDADQVDDLLVGEPYYIDGTEIGEVHVYSGRTAALIRTHEALTDSFDYFGYAAAGAGDLDLDGVDDYVVAAPYSDSAKGYVVAFSGATGAEIWTLNGTQTGAYLGRSLARISDLDGDALPELLAWRFGDDEVDVITGTGAVLFTVSGQAGAQFGRGLAGLDDVDGDGIDDFAVGEPYWTNPTTGKTVGRVRIFSGADGTALKRSIGQKLGESYGWSLARGADFDADGAADLIVGAPFADPAGIGQASGLVRVMSSKQNVELWRHEGWYLYGQLGYAAVALDDLNLDGVADYAVSAPGAANNLGQVELHSGADGARLWMIEGEGYAYAGFGTQLAAGDFNDDDVADWLVADPGYFDVSTGAYGAARVFVGCPARSASYGAGWPGTHGIPTLDCTLPPVIGEPCEVRIGNSNTGLTFGLLFVGFSPANLPTNAGGTLLVQPAVNVPFYVYGAATWPWHELPDDVSLAFLKLYVQAIELDPGASDGISFTPGLELTIGFDIP